MTEVNEIIESNESAENETSESYNKKSYRITSFEPFRVNQFVAEFGDIDSYFIKSVKIHKKNEFPRKPKITTKLYMQKDLISQVNKIFSFVNKKEFKIKLLNPIGEVIQIMELVNANPLFYTFELEYSKDNFLEVELEIECDSIKFIF